MPVATPQVEPVGGQQLGQRDGAGSRAFVLVEHVADQDAPAEVDPAQLAAAAERDHLVQVREAHLAPELKHGALPRAPIGPENKLE